VLLYPSKSEAMFVDESLIFRSDSNGEDLEGYAGAGAQPPACVRALLGAACVQMLCKRRSSSERARGQAGCRTQLAAFHRSCAREAGLRVAVGCSSARRPRYPCAAPRSQACTSR
jgi:hypothetical protein